MLEKLKPYTEYIKTPEGFLVFVGVIVGVVAILVSIYLAKKSNKGVNKGGRGGNAKATGLNATAIGGKGGGAGPGGKGGDGGGVEAIGDNVFVMGGEGGEAGQKDRGGKGGRGPLQVLIEDFPERWKETSKTFGLTDEDAKKYGKGGDGASSVQQVQKEKFEENKRNHLDPRNSNK
jgi:hypothetical protein